MYTYSPTAVQLVGITAALLIMAWCAWEGFRR